MITRYTKQFAHYLRHTRAVSALEYALLVGLMAVGVGAAIVAFSDDVQTAMDNIGKQVGKLTVGDPTTLKPDDTAP
jgi:Flp pilus assembly pilin Flp